jgi:hypothetical protein
VRAILTIEKCFDNEADAATYFVDKLDLCTSSALLVDSTQCNVFTTSTLFHERVITDIRTVIVTSIGRRDSLTVRKIVVLMRVW